MTLRLFLAAVELGSITRAALRCGIASSAAAKRLRLLEEACGLPLLQRGARSTPDGGGRSGRATCAGAVRPLGAHGG
ncbi:LysR family transcriptional regulator [Pseudoroseomonas wenyumeiae]